MGVARDAKYNSLGEDPVSMVYIPFSQAPTRSVSVLVRTGPGAPDPTRALAAAVKEIDPDLPLGQNRPLGGLMSLALLPNRIAGIAPGIFGATGLTLAGVGLSTRIEAMRRTGAKPFWIGFAAAIVTSATSLLLIRLFGPASL